MPLQLWLSRSGFSAREIGWSYACTIIATTLSPTLVGSITDCFFSAQKVLVVLIFAGMVLMYFAAQQTTFIGFFPLLLAYSLAYMPTIALINNITSTNIPDVERGFLHIRVMNTIGWIASGLTCGFLPRTLGYAGISLMSIPLLVTAGSSALSDVFIFFLPDTPPKSTGKVDIEVMLGLDVLILLRDKNFLVFFFCSFLFVVPLAFCYIFASGCLTEIGMKNAIDWMTPGQFSEIFFMLILLSFTKHFDIKKVLLLGLVIAAIRYGFFIYGNADEYSTHAPLLLGILLHGVSCDFYHATTCIYVDKKASTHTRTAAQGLTTLYCQGLGSLLGYCLGDVMMERMFTYRESINGLASNWTGMWAFGAVMIAIIAILFTIFFREPDNEIIAIKVDNRDVALTQGEVK